MSRSVRAITKKLFPGLLAYCTAWFMCRVIHLTAKLAKLQHNKKSWAIWHKVQAHTDRKMLLDSEDCWPAVRDVSNHVIRSAFEQKLWLEKIPKTINHCKPQKSNKCCPHKSEHKNFKLILCFFLQKKSKNFKQM